MEGLGMLIAGEWRDATSGETWPLVNPATEETVDEVPYGGGPDAAAALDAAAGAQASWGLSSPFDRSRLLHRAADLLNERADGHARVTTQECGKPLEQSRAEWTSAAEHLRFAAAQAVQPTGRLLPARSSRRRIDVTWEPVGVVGLITAWNFPVYNVVRTVAFALAAGCTVVAKPSEFTPRSAMLLAQTLTEAGVPSGVVNVVNGDAQEIAQEMLTDPRLRKLAFTGSVGVGKELMQGASRTVTRLSLELGGNAPAIVLPDVNDLSAVADGAAAAKYRNAGQVCIAPQRFLVHASIAEDFEQAVVAATRKQIVGDGSVDGTTVGPLISAPQRDRVESLVSRTLDAGGRLACGGGRPADRERGYFFEPTVIADTPNDAPLMIEEAFGPVLPVATFETTDEAVALANTTEYGLAAFVWSNDLRRALEVSDALDFGMVAINDWHPAAPEAPFGGVKQSGFGRESGAEGIAEYLEPKTRYIGPAI